MNQGLFKKLAMVVLPFTAAAFTAENACAAVVSYVVQDQKLWKVDDSNVNAYTRTQLSDGWGTPTAIAYRGFSQWIHIITGGSIWRAATSDGSRTLLSGSVDWSGPAQMEWNASTQKLYIVEADRLHRMNDADNSGSYTVLGNPIWTDTTSMTSYGDSLYIISNSRLYKVNPTTGSRTQLGSAVWGGPTRMTKQFWGTLGYLYVIQSGNLHQVNPSNGSWTVIGNHGWWSASTSMSCHQQSSFGSKLHIIDSNQFYRVNFLGQFFSTGMGSVWGGPTMAAGTQCYY